MGPVNVVAHQCHVQQLVAVVVRPRDLHLQPELQAVALLPARDKDVECRPSHLPRRPGKEFASSQGPGLDADTDSRRDEDSHVVRTDSLEQELPGADGGGLLVSHVEADGRPELGRRGGDPVVLTEDGGGRVVDRDPAVEVSLTLFLSDFSRVPELGHPVLQYLGRVPVQVHHEISRVVLLSGSFLVVEMSLSVNDETSVRGEVSRRGAVGKSKSGKETGGHGEHCEDVESCDHLHGLVDHHDKWTEVGDHGEGHSGGFQADDEIWVDCRA